LALAKPQWGFLIGLSVGLGGDICPDFPHIDLAYTFYGLAFRPPKPPKNVIRLYNLTLPMPVETFKPLI
jgi:hypothetical protein